MPFCGRSGRAGVGSAAAARSLGKLAEAHAKLGTAFDRGAPNLASLARQLSTEANWGAGKAEGA